jgi:hypothetical protein
MRLFLRILIIIVLAGLIVFLTAIPTAQANSHQSQTILTLEILQNRLKSPVIRDGMNTIDLTDLFIDLSPQNAEFREQFYPLLKKALQPAGTPVGLDLSNSVIQGDFTGTELGLRAPLYGEALSPLFSPAEREQLKRDRHRLMQLKQLSRSLLGTPSEPVQITVFRQPIKLVKTQFMGSINFSNSYFLKRVEATGTLFAKEADWSETRFSESVNFTGTTFAQTARFRKSIFFAKAGFNQAQFQGEANFIGSTFEGIANFNQARFKQIGNFSRSQWQANADFSSSDWENQALFTQGKFSQAIFLPGSSFAQLLSFREARFSQPINLSRASLRDQLALSDATFAPGVYINIADLTFDSESARITGDPGRIGQALSVPSYSGNETLLRQLVRNFRQQEQIPDANQIEYLTEKLRLQFLYKKITSLNINTASSRQLLNLGLSETQVQALIQSRQEQVFGKLSELLNLPEIDLATYINIRGRAIAGDSLTLGGWIRTAFHWVGLSLLLLLSCYGTHSGLVFGIGMVAIGNFSVFFWVVDRCRRRYPKPILPTFNESLWMLLSFCGIVSIGILSIFRTQESPWLTFICIEMLTIPIPVILIGLLYWQGRYHNLIHVSYFVEDGSMRQLRLMIGRLPVIPRYPLFRERYMPLLSDRRWNWLNYYDFSLNNLLRFGFNDIRVRDEHLPGLISSLVWYQWSLGILYIILLLWTLSRTIPGLNLLIYLK